MRNDLLEKPRLLFVTRVCVLCEPSRNVIDAQLLSHIESHLEVLAFGFAFFLLLFFPYHYEYLPYQEFCFAVAVHLHQMLCLRTYPTSCPVPALALGKQQQLFTCECSTLLRDF